MGDSVKSKRAVSPELAMTFFYSLRDSKQTSVSAHCHQFGKTHKVPISKLMAILNGDTHTDMTNFTKDNVVENLKLAKAPFKTYNIAKEKSPRMNAFDIYRIIGVLGNSSSTNMDDLAELCGTAKHNLVNILTGATYSEFTGFSKIKSAKTKLMFLRSELFAYGIESVLPNSTIKQAKAIGNLPVFIKPSQVPETKPDTNIATETSKSTSVPMYVEERGSGMIAIKKDDFKSILGEMRAMREMYDHIEGKLLSLIDVL